MNKATLALYGLERFIAARFKALVPLVLYGVSEALKHNTELNTPSGKLAFLSAVLAAIAVHQTKNRGAA